MCDTTAGITSDWFTTIRDWNSGTHAQIESKIINISTRSFQILSTVPINIGENINPEKTVSIGKNT